MLHQEPPNSPSPDQLALLLAAAGQARVHRELIERVADISLPDPERGQLWRLEYAGNAALAVVWVASTTTVSVMPVSEDPTYQDAHTVVFTQTPLHSAIGIWPSLEASVPTWVLDRCLGQLESEPLVESRHAFRTQLQDPSSPPPPDHSWSDLNRYRDQLANRLEPFIALSWADERPTVDGTSTLHDLLRNRDLDLQWLGSHLGIEEPHRAFLVWEGKRSLDDREAAVLATELNVDAADLRSISRNVPIELRAQTIRPRYRPQVQQWATLRALGEADARERIEEHTMALAARSTGDDIERWQALLEQILADELRTP